MEARGNLPSYPAQGSNYVRSSLNYGPFAGGSTPISTGERLFLVLRLGRSSFRFIRGFVFLAFDWRFSVYQLVFFDFNWALRTFHRFCSATLFSPPNTH